MGLILPPSEAEEEVAYCKQTDDGLQLYSAIGGYGGSSTRAELAAGIVALLSNSAVHIGSDSEAFVNKANEIIDLVDKGKDPQQWKSWKLRTDGDL